MSRTYIAFIIAIFVVIVGVIWYTAKPSVPISENQVGDEVSTSGQTVRVEARIGERVQVLDETIAVLRVVEDSRCPTDVQCIQAGTVRAEGTVLGGMGEGNIPFRLGETSSSEVNTFKLVAVRPNPRSGEAIDDNDYVFVIDVTRRSD